MLSVKKLMLILYLPVVRGDLRVVKARFSLLAFSASCRVLASHVTFL